MHERKESERIEREMMPPAEKGERSESEERVKVSEARERAWVRENGTRFSLLSSHTRSSRGASGACAAGQRLHTQACLFLLESP